MKNRRFLIGLCIIVIANFLAQIPYVIYQYHGQASVVGLFLMVSVFVWFIISYVLLVKRTAVGFGLMLAFLIVEFLFYLSTQITQAMSGQGILLHVLHPHDTTLFVVFGIGYINMVAAAFYAVFLIRHRKELTG